MSRPPSPPLQTRRRRFQGMSAWAALPLLLLPPLAVPARAQPAAAAPASVVMPFDFSAGKVFVPVVINGSAPQWFGLDTGSPMTVIDSRLCDRLGLHSREGGRTAGAGEGSAEMRIVEDAHVSLAGVPVPEDHVVVSIDLAGTLSSFSAHELNGLIGNDFVAGRVVKIDYAARQVTLYESEGWTYDGQGQVLDVTLGGYDFIRGWVTPPGGKPIKATFMIDTGAGLTVSLTTHFVNRCHFLDGHIPTVHASVGYGIGGEVVQDVARFDLLRLGDVELPRPVVNLSQEKSGALAMTAMDGIIGGEIFRKFTVIFDLARHRMILEKNATFDEPTEFDMSGLTLRAGEAGGLEVFRVIPGLPGAEAGLAEGDVVEAVDGRAVAAPDRDAVRDMLKKDGQVRKLTIRRAQEHLEIAITLRRLV